MEKDLDKKLYNDYLNGEKEAFKFLYDKYKSKIEYFIYTIVKDYEIAEDLTQETFIYVMQNKMQENTSFKYYIYLVAKSKSFNYIKKEKRRTEITELYVFNGNQQIEKDLLEIVSKEETKKELLESIDLLNERYRNAIYLINIAGLSYEETANILNETIQNTKNLVHRGKMQLRKILLKKGFDEMSKSSKIIILVLCISILLTGSVYGIMKILKKNNGKAELTPTFTSKLSSVDENKVWVGTFNLVWNDFMNDVIKQKIEFEDGPSVLADELNKQTFTINDLNSNSYFKTHGKATQDLKIKIENEIKQKFNENSEILDKVEWKNPDAFILYAMLKKEFNYLEKFPTLNDDIFGNSEEKVKYFGINPNTSQEASKNIEILFYNSSEDFAIKLKTKENDEVFLYRTTDINKSFEEIYQKMLEKQAEYNGNKEWDEADSLNVPFIKVKNEINYDELCGRMIKGTDLYIEQALQTIEFELNNCGGSVKSEALIKVLEGIRPQNGRKFIYDDDFILYLKESQKEKPYFALKVDNSNVLLSDEN